MFGLTTPVRNLAHTTSSSERPCQLCHALESDYGRPFRLLTNYDAGFLLSLLESQAGIPSPELPSSLCLGGSVCRPYWIESAPVHPRYVAAVMVIWLDIKLQDDLHDGSGVFTHFLQRAVQSNTRLARQVLISFGFDPVSLYTQADRQSTIESSCSPTFETLSDPTAQAYGLVFGHTAQLANAYRNRPVVMHMGETFGKLAYFLDAYRDFDSDRRRSRFNALASMFPEITHKRRQDIPVEIRRAWFTQAWNWSQDILNDLDALGLARRPQQLYQSINCHLRSNLLRSFQMSTVST